MTLLRAAHTAIKRADPGAKVVLGAITNVAWRWLGKIYKVHGARRLFDVVAVNAFTTTPPRCIEFLRLVRRAIDRLGDRRKPLLDTEMSWPTRWESPRDASTGTRPRPARRAISPRSCRCSAKHRRALGLQAFYYYTWMDAGDPGAFSDFDFAGLSSLEPNGRCRPSRACAAFKRAALTIEGCRAKGPVATRCLR